MKDRIRLIMENERMTPSAFADKLQIGRAVMSHILTGRNNPSLEVVTRILSQLNYIDPDWLLAGEGEMLKSAKSNSSTPVQQNQISSTQNTQRSKDIPDLFAHNSINPPIPSTENEYRKEIIVEQPLKQEEKTVEERVIIPKMPDRKVTKIIIYYSDNTFETFNEDKRPL